MPGNIFVISAPSGAGKTTVVKRLLSARENLVLAVSCATREPRREEKDGVDYFFVGETEFRSMIKKGKFAEWADVYGRLYGTPKTEIDKNIAAGKDVLLDVDVQGAAKVRKKYPSAVLIFLMPPSFDELKRRLKDRGTNKGEDLEKRIATAGEEFSRRHEYDYQVVNEDLDEACDEIMEIIDYYNEHQI